MESEIIIVKILYRYLLEIFLIVLKFLILKSSVIILSLAMNSLIDLVQRSFSKARVVSVTVPIFTVYIIRTDLPTFTDICFHMHDPTFQRSTDFIEFCNRELCIHVVIYCCLLVPETTENHIFVVIYIIVNLANLVRTDLANIKSDVDI